MRKKTGMKRAATQNSIHKNWEFPGITESPHNNHHTGRFPLIFLLSAVFNTNRALLRQCSTRGGWSQRPWRTVTPRMTNWPVRNTHADESRRAVAALRSKQTTARKTPDLRQFCDLHGEPRSWRRRAAPCSLVLRGPASPTANICKDWPRKTPGSALQENKKNKKSRGPWLCRAGQKASLKPSVPSSLADKAHFPFITLYHKHKSTGKAELGSG